MHDHVGDLEAKITATVLHQLAENKAMEVDSEASVDARVSALESRLDQVASQQEVLQETVTRQGVETNAQMQTLQTVVKQQNDQLDKAYQNASEFQDKLLLQSKQQEATLNNMFRDQMQQFEALLAKQNRTASAPY